MAGAPLALMVVLGRLTLRPDFARARRYGPGREWDHPAAGWSADGSRRVVHMINRGEGLEAGDAAVSVGG